MQVSEIEPGATSPEDEGPSGHEAWSGPGPSVGDGPRDAHRSTRGRRLGCSALVGCGTARAAATSRASAQTSPHWPVAGALAARSSAPPGRRCTGFRRPARHAALSDGRGAERRALDRCPPSPPRVRRPGRRGVEADGLAWLPGRPRRLRGPSASPAASCVTRGGVLDVVPPLTLHDAGVGRSVGRLHGVGDLLASARVVVSRSPSRCAAGCRCWRVAVRHGPRSAASRRARRLAPCARPAA